MRGAGSAGGSATGGLATGGELTGIGRSGVGGSAAGGLVAGGSVTGTSVVGGVVAGGAAAGFGADRLTATFEVARGAETTRSVVGTRLILAASGTAMVVVGIELASRKTRERAELAVAASNANWLRCVIQSEKTTEVDPSKMPTIVNQISTSV